MQKQINKFIEEFNKSGMSFTAFKAMIARTRLDEFNLIYSRQTMISYGKSFTAQQLNPEVYRIVKRAINYKPRSNWYCCDFEKAK